MFRRLIVKFDRGKLKGDWFLLDGILVKETSRNNNKYIQLNKFLFYWQRTY